MATETLSYHSRFYYPAAGFYGGASYSQLVPYPFPVSIAGHPYQLQWDANSIGVWGAKFKRNSLPLLRTQADASNTPGEQSVSPEQFWRRSQETWQLGEGQVYLDRASSDLRRYHDGEGINPWEPWGFTLLNQTSLKKSSTNTGLQCITAGSNVYLTNGSTLQFSTNLTSWTTVTGTPSTALSIGTDGYNVWTAHSASCIYATTSGASASTSYATGKTTDLVRFVKSRLMAAGAGVLYNITKAGALSGTDILLDLSARNFTWVDIVGAPTQIYAAGYAGDKSYIYRTAIKADGTALDVPIIAGQLPDGEIVRSLGEYLGYILIGTDLGIRFCSIANDGSLIIGSLIESYDPVYCFEGQDRFVWWGNSNYDSKSGLGRLDLTAFTSTLTPAYASDIMADTLGTVRTVVTFNNLRIFTVDGVGLYSEVANTPVTSGTFVSGVISYGISDPKVAMYLDVKHEPLNGTITAGIVVDQNDSDTAINLSTAIGTSSKQGSVSPTDPFPCGQLRGENFQILFTLTPTANISPVVTRWTLRSYPAPARTAQWDVPILLDPMVNAGEKDWPFDVNAELDFLTGLHQSQEIITLQVSEASYQVVMYDYQWIPEAIGENGVPRGTFYAQLREIVG
jgi:hypothetical protein